MAALHRRLLPVAFLALLSVLAACNGDNDDDAGAAGAPTASAGEHEPGGDEHHDAAHWSYAGDTGPAHWAGLSREFAVCDAGTRQSPIDIAAPQAEPVDIADPVLDWQVADLELVNNGHTLQANVPEGSTSELAGQHYDLLQFHWHRPSEHLLGGAPFAMELHFVHADASGNLAVLAVLLEEGDGDALYDALWEQPPEEGDARTLSAVDMSRLLPGELKSFTYPGSLTTPPCAEGVAWHILTAPAEISAESIEQFPYDGNARPVQPLNERAVERDSS